MTSSGRNEYSRDVEQRADTSLAFEKTLIPSAGRPAQAETEENHPRLNISVIFTSVEATVAALRRAGALAGNLGLRITLLVPQVVPYPLPLESPPVLLDWNEHRFRVIAGESPVETIVRLYLCRDSLDTLKRVLSPKSVVVVGGSKAWWPFTREKMLARRLRRAGHQVIFTEKE